MIYEIVAVHPKRQAAVTYTDPYPGCPSKRSGEPCLAGVCHQIREEILPIFYSKNAFGIMIDDF